jgi:general secretion pathway protein H
LAYKLKGNKGFTLLEVMLVVLIIGIVTSFAVYSMAPIGPGRQAKSEAQGLMAAIDYAQQHAILSHQPYGLVIDNRGYQFFVYEGLEQGQWQGTQNPGLKQIETLSQIKLILPTPNLDGSPSIVLLPSKEPQVYTIEVNLDGYGWQLRSLPPKPLTLIAMPHE